jgi:hypothetical protein
VGFLSSWGAAGLFLGASDGHRSDLLLFGS